MSGRKRKVSRPTATVRNHQKRKKATEVEGSGNPVLDVPTLTAVITENVTKAVLDKLYSAKDTVVIGSLDLNGSGEQQTPVVDTHKGDDASIITNFEETTNELFLNPIHPSCPPYIRKLLLP